MTAAPTARVLGSTHGRDPQYLYVAQYDLRNVGGLYYENGDARPTVCRVSVYLDYLNYHRCLWFDQAPFGNAQFLLDHDDKLRFALGTTETLVSAVGWKPDPDDSWRTFELDILRHEGLQPVRMSADARSAFLIGVDHDEAFAALYRLDPQTRQLQRSMASTTPTCRTSSWISRIAR